MARQGGQQPYAHARRLRRVGQPAAFAVGQDVHPALPRPSRQQGGADGGLQFLRRAHRQRAAVFRQRAKQRVFPRIQALRRVKHHVFVLRRLPQRGEKLRRLLRQILADQQTAVAVLAKTVEPGRGGRLRQQVGGKGKTDRHTGQRAQYAAAEARLPPRCGKAAETVGIQPRVRQVEAVARAQHQLRFSRAARSRLKEFGALLVVRLAALVGQQQHIGHARGRAGRHRARLRLRRHGDYGHIRLFADLPDMGEGGQTGHGFAPQVHRREAAGEGAAQQRGKHPPARRFHARARADDGDVAGFKQLVQRRGKHGGLLFGGVFGFHFVETAFSGGRYYRFCLRPSEKRVCLMRAGIRVAAGNACAASGRHTLHQVRHVLRPSENRNPVLAAPKLCFQTASAARLYLAQALTAAS